MDSVGKKALKAGTWYTICTFILKGLTFITMPVFNRVMTQGDIGNYSNFSSWVLILTSVFTLDLFSTVNLAHYEYKDKIYEYMSMNYFMAGINREKARIAIKIMKKAINVLRDEKS